MFAEHDWFSFASIFDFFRPADTDARGKWQEATDHVRHCAHQAVLTILDAMADNQLTLIADASESLCKFARQNR